MNYIAVESTQETDAFMQGTLGHGDEMTEGIDDESEWVTNDLVKITSIEEVEV